MNGNINERTDTMFTRRSFVLEPIKTYYFKAETNRSTGVTTEQPIRRILQRYNLTDISKMTAMTFNVDTLGPGEEIKALKVEAKTPRIGYPLGLEPFLNNGIRLEDLSRSQDTVINGKKCILLKTTKEIKLSTPGQEDSVVSLMIAVDPSLKDYSFPFISEKIPNSVGGGAVTLIKSTLKSGLVYYMSFTYRKSTPAEKQVFNKYEALYLSNSAMLDELKK